MEEEGQVEGQVPLRFVILSAADPHCDWQWRCSQPTRSARAARTAQGLGGRVLGAVRDRSGRARTSRRSAEVVRTGVHGRSSR